MSKIEIDVRWPKVGRLTLPARRAAMLAVTVKVMIPGTTTTYQSVKGELDRPGNSRLWPGAAMSCFYICTLS